MYSQSIPAAALLWKQNICADITGAYMRRCWNERSWINNCTQSSCWEGPKKLSLHFGQTLLPRVNPCKYPSYFHRNIPFFVAPCAWDEYLCRKGAEMPNYCQQFDATIVLILSSHNFFQTLTTLVRTLLVFQGYSIIPPCSSPQWFPRHGLPHYLLCSKVLLSCFDESLPSAPFLSHLSLVALSQCFSWLRTLSLSHFVSLVTCF